MKDEKMQDRYSDDSKDVVDKDFNNAVSTAYAKSSMVITDSLLNCQPAIARASVPYYLTLKEGPVVYEIHVKNEKCEWNVWHRFQTFQILHQMLKDFIVKESLKCELPIIPFRHIKFLVNHKSNDFCEERRVLLDNYLKILLSTKDLRDLSFVIGFLSHSDEALSTEKVSQKEINEYERAKVESIMVTDENDDITSVSIPIFRVVGSEYVLYSLSVHNMNKEPEYSQWNVLHRYSEFKEFDTALRLFIMEEAAHLITKMPQLPMRQPKMIRNHFQEHFVEKRRLLLESYIQRLIKVREFRRYPLTIKFLGVREQ